MDIHGTAVAEVVKAPDLVQQLIAGVYPVGRGCQIEQQFHFLGGRVDFLAVHGQFKSIHVDDHFVKGQPAGLLFRGDTGGAAQNRRLTFDKLVIDMDAFELMVDGKKVDTPPKEMELLFYLASSPNRVYTRNQLLDEVWGFDYFGDSRTVDVHVKRLREKLEGVSENWSLKTVWGVGYKFEVL